MTRIVLTALVMAGLFAPQAQAEDMTVPLNRSRIISTEREIGEAMIANPAIADIHVHGSNRVSIIGVARGQTTLRILDRDGEILQSVGVNVTYDLPAIRRALKEFLPAENIGVELINTNVALVGSVSDASAVDKALRIVNQFIEKEQASAGQAAGQGITEQGAAATAESPVVNLLQVMSGQQVMLRVRVGEIRRTALKRLGASLQGVSVNGSASIFGATDGGIPGLTTGSGLVPGQFEVPDDSFGIVSGVIRKSDLTIGATLEALENDGLLKVLAEPNLVALSGEQAEFLAGGEFPVPVPQAGGAAGGGNLVTIQYKPFGVSVQFIPYVLSENRIRLNVLPEVSELSTEDAVTINGTVVPSLTTRRARTTVELAPGESFMIAGLIRDEMSTVLRQIPGVNEIPILSALFRSSEYQRNESELVIAVTPYLVDPLKSDDVRLPTDNLRPPSTMEMFFYGALSSIAHGERRLSQTPSLEGPVGFILE